MNQENAFYSKCERKTHILPELFIAKLSPRERLLIPLDEIGNSSFVKRYFKFSVDIFCICFTGRIDTSWLLNDRNLLLPSWHVMEK